MKKSPEVDHLKIYRSFLLGLLLVCICSHELYSQKIEGRVQAQDAPLVGASVYWAGTSVGVTTDSEGKYNINRVKGYDKLVAVFLGYMPDSVILSDNIRTHDFLLETDEHSIDAVVVTEFQRGNSILNGSVTKQELISFSGLTKMACCNLAESFENSASVSVGYSDAVSGARQIRMLGLSGIYTQLLDETRPILRGLGSPYGLNYTPGMWLQSIQVSKGVSSVVNGHEAMTGQINLEHRKPTDPDRLFINGYLDHQLRTELNVTSAHSLNDRLSTIILAHGSIDNEKLDHNDDGFLDTPLTRQINVANRWLYSAPSGFQLRAGVKYLFDKRNGGQKDYDASQHRGGTEFYGSRILNSNFNGYVKAAHPVGRIVFNDEKDEQLISNIAVIADYNFYQQRSYFGLKDYDASQNSFMASLLYNYHINKRNKLVLGANYTTDHYDELLQDRYTNGRNGSGDYVVNSAVHDLGRVENELGLFGEYTYSFRDVLDIIGGMRADHNDLHGWFFTPRAHLRWNIVPDLAMRLSAGKGFRSSNFITDNIGILATGRRIDIDPGLDRLESSTTFGGSLTWTFTLGRDRNASLSTDIFHTRFSNYVYADQELASGVVYLYNPDGNQYTTTYQVDFNWTPLTGFDIFATFRYNDAYVDVRQSDPIKVETPLVDRFKTLINLQYATKFRRWVFDFTAQLNGQSRLPDQNTNLYSKEYSPVYPIFFAQISHRIRKADLYLGVENIGDYKQKHPVISPGSPFDDTFNSSVVWGPLMGRKIYLGFRFNL